MIKRNLRPHFEIFYGLPRLTSSLFLLRPQPKAKTPEAPETELLVNHFSSSLFLNSYFQARALTPIKETWRRGGGERRKSVKEGRQNDMEKRRKRKKKEMLDAIHGKEKEEKEESEDGQCKVKKKGELEEKEGGQ
ncbi:hypothetical protein Pcinc_013774 [Petrolisthes cinctipes]|uniref:Uncharacterized protein n=1 Tax=Petrolisthes cinctipes TaxID=88211 RepID=A0AAE1FYE1_PETCI|nr:hypothetical protein Pcinc_013774 [Petrolisthes cinctipes]